MKLNLGCGKKKLAGYTNVDMFGEPDLKLDLFRLPWPWEDNSIDEIACHHFLEHVPDFRSTWMEFHRVLKPGGKLWIRVPNWRCPQAPWPEQHRHQFSIYTFAYHINSGVDYDLGRKLFETVRLRHWYGAKLRFLMPFANIHPLAWDWLGLPVSEIEWIGKKL